jgi:hypothetical protein
MFDPQLLIDFLAQNPPETRARTSQMRLSMAQSDALWVMLGGPARQIQKGRPSSFWTVIDPPDDRLSIDPRAVSVLVKRELAEISGNDGMARLTKRGRWYARSAAADKADRLMAFLIR